MPVLKRLPEDFIVVEQSDLSIKENGPYLLLEVTKRGMNTEEVAGLLAKAFKVSRKAVGYSGNKDREAVTTQWFTIKGRRKEDAKQSLPGDLRIEAQGYLDESLALGMHARNRFRITVRDITGHERLSLPSIVPNYFDEQRFQVRNAVVGEALVRKDFLGAVRLLGKDRRYGKGMVVHLAKHPNDHVGAVRLVPVPILKLYLHAFQSRLWNEILARYVMAHARSVARLAYSQGKLLFPKDNFNIENKSIPVPGFGHSKEDAEISALVSEVLARHGINESDFVIRQLPNLSLEGADRPAFMDVQGFSAAGFEDDEIFPGKMKTTLRFSLGKGSYATMLVKALFVK